MLEGGERVPAGTSERLACDASRRRVSHPDRPLTLALTLFGGEGIATVPSPSDMERGPG